MAGRRGRRTGAGGPQGHAAQQLHELGDVLAWLASIAEQLDLSLDDAAMRYADGCPRCSSIPCRCPGADDRDGSDLR